MSKNSRYFYSLTLRARLLTWANVLRIDITIFHSICLHIACIIAYKRVNYRVFCLNDLQVHLITKTIYETLNQDFNNTFFILTKIISFNRLGFYIALTLFWSLYLHFFKKDTHHYYKMYDVQKFFKLLQHHEKDIDCTEMEVNAMFQLLLLISIYQNYVLLNKDNLADNHNVFHDVFRVTPSDVEKLKDYLSKMKMLVEIRYPVRTNHNSDALMVSKATNWNDITEFLV